MSARCRFGEATVDFKLSDCVLQRFSSELRTLSAAFKL